MCLHLFNPPAPGCEETDGRTPYNSRAGRCGTCPCVPPLWKLTFPAYLGVNSGLPYPAQTLYLGRIPQYTGNVVEGGNDPCVWESTTIPEDPEDPTADYRYLLGWGLSYSQSPITGTKRLGWGILYYDRQKFLPFVGVTSWIPDRRFRCLRANEFVIEDEHFIDTPRRLFVEPFWP